MEKTNKTIRSKIIKNLPIVIVIFAYFSLINYSYINFEEEVTQKIQKIASISIVLISVLIFEIAYHKDSGNIAITGIEILVVAIHTLTIFNVTAKINIVLKNYILISACVILIYYLLKLIIIYTNEKRKYLSSLSDISEIVENEPVKKKAKKKK